jgi:hypothetical protein
MEFSKHFAPIGKLLAASVLLLVPASSFAGFGISITVAPPVLPVYAQPPCPGDGYIWTPGYWAWGPDGYYWVPGVWVMPPRLGVLWTPGYWGFGNGVYLWHAGYWGPHVGFYGGVSYGFGYPGSGFFGGFWAGNVFRYNRAVVNVNTTVVRNVYVDRTYINRNTFVSHASFNGPGGTMARPSAGEMAAAHEQHFQATSAQFSHQNLAAHDRNQFASVNHGRPAVAATNAVNGRAFNQQGRIANGIASGRMTAGEARNVEGREANLNHQIHNDRQANGGRLTPQEHQQVNRQQNNLSRSIYRDNHNAATARYGNNQVGQRRANQQARIANGVASGRMTAGAAAHAENRQQHINRQVAADRHANGGRLTPQQHQQVNHAQNNASHQIYQANHNANHGRR